MSRPGRPRKDEAFSRRERLLEQAVRQFGEQGYGGLNLETFARQSQVSLRTVYSQFGGKAGLFSAVVRQCSDRFAAALPVEGNEAGSLESMLFEFACEYLYRLTRPDLIRLRAQILAEAPRFPELALEFYREGPGRTLNHLARFFARQQVTGIIAGDIDPQFLAGQFLNALRGERFQRLQLGIETIPSEEEVLRWSKDAVNLFLRGCLKNVSSSG
jgi:TetR/AcrR family transcriptional regulator, mexJK operon transcriptional repressor